ncbi:MAG: hypothetical protein K1X65_14090 [Caldilineales bacterium]|nr:hypothetical protein [Caldilineales bacterium]MCW5858530.1 hypothetical protein [Caldilineales bacterium]
MNQQANSAASRITLIASAFIVGLALLALLVALQMRPRPAPAPAVRADSALAAYGPLGAYSGIVKLDWALTGVYSDTLPTPTPQPDGTPSPILGDVNLGILFHPDSSPDDGHVDLGNTLVFTREHTITATPVGPTPGPGTPAPAAVPLAVGPKVSVAFNGLTLRVESERFAMTTGAGQRLQRQFRLIGATDAGDSHRFTGEYRETIWGFGARPLTLVGTFILVQPPNDAPGAEFGQWATTATASSEYANPDWSANQATGAPNVETCSDNIYAWAPAPSGPDPEWLRLGYATPVYATAVRVRESWVTGSVKGIDLVEPDGTIHTLTIPADTTPCPGLFVVTFPQTTYVVVEVIVHTQIADWEEIDAVELVGVPVPTATPTPTPTANASTATPTRTPTTVASTATPTRTPTPAGPTATPTRTSTPGGPTATPTVTGPSGFKLFLPLSLRQR